MLQSIGIPSLLLILLIVILLFGTKKLRNMGGDLGSALRNFKTAMKDGDQGSESAKPEKLEADSAPTASQQGSREPQNNDQKPS